MAATAKIACSSCAIAELSSPATSAIISPTTSALPRSIARPVFSSVYASNTEASARLLSTDACIVSSGARLPKVSIRLSNCWLIRSNESALLSPLCTKPHGSRATISLVVNWLSTPRATSNCWIAAVSVNPRLTSIVLRGVILKSSSIRAKPASTKLPKSIPLILSLPPTETTMLLSTRPSNKNAPLASNEDETG